MGNTQDIGAALENDELDSKVKFKGGDPTPKETVEAFFEINSFEVLKKTYDGSDKLQTAFDDLGLDFPRSDSDVSSFLYDLDNEKCKDLIAKLNL